MEVLSSIKNFRTFYSAYVFASKYLWAEGNPVEQLPERFKVGDTVVQWIALLPHSRKALRMNQPNN